MKQIFFIGILMVSLAYGQDSTVTQVVERFATQMNTALDEIEDFQTQINSLRVRILALEYVISNTDTSKFTIQQIDDAITSLQYILANSDTSEYTVKEIDTVIKQFIPQTK